MYAKSNFVRNIKKNHGTCISEVHISFIYSIFVYIHAFSFIGRNLLHKNPLIDILL